MEQRKKNQRLTQMIKSEVQRIIKQNKKQKKQKNCPLKYLYDDDGVLLSIL